MKYAHFLAKDTSSIASGRQMETMWTTIENLKIIRTATLAGGLCSEPVVLHSPLSSGASWGPVLRRAGPQAEESGHDSLKNAREETIHKFVGLYVTVYEFRGMFTHLFI